LDDPEGGAGSLASASPTADDCPLRTVSLSGALELGKRKRIETHFPLKVRCIEGDAGETRIKSPTGKRS
jgi:hypothetical protein